MFKFDSEAFIKEMESLEGVEETPLDYEEFESTWEYDKYVIDAQIKDLEREIQSDLNRIATLEREVEAYV